MCNLYSHTKSQDAVRKLFEVTLDQTGNLPPMPGIFPDQMAPIIRRYPDGARSLELMRWGFPPPKINMSPVTNVRNTASSFWRGWLKPEFRCLVPATSFCEYAPETKESTWFALGEDRPLFAFAGIWRPWTGPRGTKKER